MKEFLETRFRSLEYLDPKQNVTRSHNPKSFHVASVSCILCSGDHKLCHCKEFAAKNIDSRREFARTSKICFNCLNRNHNVYSCRQSTRCHKCKKRHHTLLHPETVNAVVTDSPADVNVAAATTASTSYQGESTTPVCCYANTHSQGLLATALVNVESRSGAAFVLRALMDQGSQVSFITESAVQLLGLKKLPAHTDILRLGDDEGISMPSKWIVKFKLQSRLDPNFVLYVDAYVLTRLTSHLPERRIVQALPLVSTLELADPSFHTPGNIDLLLSTRVVGAVLEEGLIRGPPGAPVAQRTKLGWILSGEVQTVTQKPACYGVVVNTQVNINDLLKKFWELEESEVSSNSGVILTEEEQKCEELYSKTTKKDDTGRYIVRLPFKTDNPQCKIGKSEDIASKRFCNLERKLTRNPEFGKEYKAVIQEYLDLEHAEVVPELEVSRDSVYLPHHAVVRTDKSTSKVRVVFDASCPAGNGVSLNSELMVGPTLQPDLRNIIMRWRCHPITLVADIIKMYRQIKIADEDVDYQRILWRDNTQTELQHLRLLRVTFGTSSAPYLAVRSLQQLVHDEGHDFPLVAKRVLSDFYVDDFLSGCETISEGEQIYRQMSELLSRGGFQLQKWSTNSDELLLKIRDRTCDGNENIIFEKDNVMKILGLTWDRNFDEFQYTVHLPTLKTPVTKRRVVSDIARIFDPLGWISPVVITAKVFIQRLWLSGIEWDEELPHQLLTDWLVYRDNLHKLTQFRLPRWIHTSRKDIELELQGFCDASNSAFSAVVYLRSVDSNGNIHISLIASKTKVAPVKQVSIPRLELCGAVVLAKLLSEVSVTLGVSKNNLHAWTDSSVVLAWLRSHPSRWKTFVGNRVSEILTIMDGNQWSHVQSKDNPADCASRGVSPMELLELESWIEGPSWLKNKVIEYSKGEVINTHLEEKKDKFLCNVVKIEDGENELIKRFSSLSKLTRVIAYCRRFLNLKSKTKVSTNLRFSEIQEALMSCIRVCQSHYFGEILDKHTGSDKVTRVVSLRCKGSIIKRPTSKLIVLPVTTSA
ncbi:uncharacterized protein LOC123692575 [Colias croceus]|uniref:uncharacterized protein LOC123692575 n=1 Tax=Colias crocea TaxID=72248 RepID=UPI001E27F9CD|nr:uncharacterized protein LOC123692575 [Colias croceus]